METIRNYLETMFAHLPNTEAVLRAKRELLQMMEDKYNELRGAGKSENEAVGTVIAEFGNLDELAEDLGLSYEVRAEHAAREEAPRRPVGLEEARDYLRYAAARALGISLGVSLCILSVTGPILGGVSRYVMPGVAMMFAMILAAIALFIIFGVLSGQWRYLKRELCSIDYATANYIHEARERYRINYAVQLVIGIILCVICWMPAAFFSDIGMYELGRARVGVIGAAILFGLVGIGVFLILHAGMVMHSYDVLLRLNARNTVSGRYVPEQEEHYASETAERLMRVYWPTVRCLYLIWSFLTFAWHRTWILWPIAAAIHALCRSVLRRREAV